MKSAQIYGLVDPEGVIRSIGKTERKLRLRLLGHWSEAHCSNKNNHRLNWLRTLEKMPQIVLIEKFEFTVEAEWANREKYWIALFKAYGHRLVNSTDGGEGVTMTPGIREKIAGALKGRQRSAEHNQKLREICRRNAENNIGKRRSEIAKEKRAATLAAHPEIREKIVAAARKTRSWEARQNMRAPKPPAFCAMLSQIKTGVSRPPFSASWREAIAEAGRGRKRKTASSIYYGVSWNKKLRKWKAQLTCANRTISLGHFIQELEAARAVDAYVRANNLSIKLLNFP